MAALLVTATLVAMTLRSKSEKPKPPPRPILPPSLMKRLRAKYEEEMAEKHAYTHLFENQIGSTERKEKREVEKLIHDLDIPEEQDKCDELHAMKVECAGRCRAGEKCTNSRLYHNQCARLELFRHANPVIGKAVRTKQDIAKNQLVAEFRGKWYTENYFKGIVRRWSAAKRAMNYFISALGKKLILDPTDGGSLLRFSNHKCDPNCLLEFDGEEITWDYGDSYSGAFLDEDSSDPIRCLCMSENCRGYIVSKRKAQELKAEEAKKAQKTRKRKAQGTDEKKNDAKKAKSERKIAVVTQQNNKKSPSPASRKTTVVQEKNDSIAQTNNATITQTARRKRSVPFAALDAPRAPKKFIIPAPADPVICPSNKNDDSRESSHDQSRQSSRSPSFTPPPTSSKVIMDTDPLQLRVSSPVPSSSRTPSSTPSCTPPPPPADDNVNNIIEDEILQPDESSSAPSSSLSVATATPSQDDLINDEPQQEQFNDVVAVASPALSPTLDSLDGSALVTALEVLEGRIHTFEGLKIKLDGMGDKKIRKKWQSIIVVMGLRRKYIVDGFKSLKATVNYLIHDSQQHQFIQGLIDRSNSIATDYESLLKLAQEYGNQVLSAHHVNPTLKVAWNKDIFGNAYDSFKISSTVQLRTVRNWEKDIANK
ncbi:hypothetical protein PRIPAC_95249 [Pristionchus pacificus]|uniref:SET domain-containing protein n=1 Tax=Pristionchus pacificus TaxID=54126 RepID=A0A2A6BK97_PRIPA|nr:hypothetical protein PRIPAC_95249 [Pristionchus pacificus]|eukprot:PDM66258.1 SET domain-containing protein [Pristionchus pacificus]